MRSKLLSVTLTAIAALACTRAPERAPAVQVASTTYGRVSDGPTVTPRAILDDIDAYDGKVVRVEGTVAAVCPNRGCWMDVAGAAGEKIRIKVKDGEVVFPLSAKGKSVVAEGVVVKIPADPAADSTATCAGGEVHEDGHDCSRPAGATARIDGFGAQIRLQ